MEAKVVICAIPIGVDLTPTGIDLTAKGIDLTATGIALTPTGIDLTPTGRDQMAYIVQKNENYCVLLICYILFKASGNCFAQREGGFTGYSRKPA